MLTAATAIEEIRKILEQEKTFSEWPAWVADSNPREGRLSFVTGIATGGVSFPGFRIRGSAPQGVVGRDVVLQVEALLGSRRWLHISRIEYKPLGGHLNPFSRRDVPRQIPPGVSHVHGFEDNAVLGLDAFSPTSNLPIARILDPSPTSLRGFLRSAGTMLAIPDFEHIDSPPWQGRLPV